MDNEELLDDFNTKSETGFGKKAFSYFLVGLSAVFGVLLSIKLHISNDLSLLWMRIFATTSLLILILSCGCGMMYNIKQLTTEEKHTWRSIVSLVGNVILILISLVIVVNALSGWI